MKKGLATTLAAIMVFSSGVTAAFASQADNSDICYTVSGEPVDLSEMEKVEEDELFDYNSDLARKALVWVREKYPNALRFDFYKNSNGKAMCKVWLDSGKAVIEECIEVNEGSCYVEP